MTSPDFRTLKLPDGRTDTFRRGSVGYTLLQLVEGSIPVEWLDSSPAVTWAGRLGLKERWENRDNPEYQEMLRRMKTR